MTTTAVTTGTPSRTDDEVQKLFDAANAADDQVTSIRAKLATAGHDGQRATLRRHLADAERAKQAADDAVGLACHERAAEGRPVQIGIRVPTPTAAAGGSSERMTMSREPDGAAAFQREHDDAAAWRDEQLKARGLMPV